jgi:antitoxin component YwqK of YwqJK toxin-antitoxin module
MPTLFSRLRLTAIAAILAAVGVATAQEAAPGADTAPAAEGTNAPTRESVTIEPYTGPPIYLPEGEAPPPPTEVEARVVKENFPGTETVRFERRVVKFSDDSIVSDGPHKEFFSNGQLYVEGEFNKGKAVGKWVFHHPNGKVAKEVTYKDGRPDGEVKLFNEEEKLVARREYAAGLRTGTWETYSDDGEQKLREENYKDGKADGAFRTWYTNGQLRQETTFVAGKLEGLATEWTRVGDKRAEVNFKNGLKDGVSKLWQADGKVVEQNFAEGKPAPK